MEHTGHVLNSLEVVSLFFELFFVHYQLLKNLLCLNTPVCSTTYLFLLKQTVNLGAKNPKTKQLIGLNDAKRLYGGEETAELHDITSPLVYYYQQSI